MERIGIGWLCQNVGLTEQCHIATIVRCTRLVRAFRSAQRNLFNSPIQGFAWHIICVIFPFSPCSTPEIPILLNLNLAKTLHYYSGWVLSRWVVSQWNGMEYFAWLPLSSLFPFPLWKLHLVIYFNFPAQNEKLGRLHSLLAVYNAIMGNRVSHKNTMYVRGRIILLYFRPFPGIKFKLKNIKSIVCVRFVYPIQIEKYALRLLKWSTKYAPGIWMWFNKFAFGSCI